LPVEDLQEVYDGVWGYNAVIATASLSCVFFAFNGMSFLLAMLNLAATIAAQYALRANMTLVVCCLYIHLGSNIRGGGGHSGSSLDIIF
jgi:urea transporter